MTMPFMPGLWGHGPTGHQVGSPAADRATAKADGLEQRLERALMTMEAMWSLLRDRLGVTDEELAQRIVELDESDGYLDGKVRREPLQCTHCERTVPSATELSWTITINGSDRAAASEIPSCTAPVRVAPSPVQVSATWSAPRSWNARANPAQTGTRSPTWLIGETTPCFRSPKWRSRPLVMLSPVAR